MYIYIYMSLHVYHKWTYVLYICIYRRCPTTTPWTISLIPIAILDVNARFNISYYAATLTLLFACSRQNYPSPMGDMKLLYEPNSPYKYLRFLLGIQKVNSILYICHFAHCLYLVALKAAKWPKIPVDGTRRRCCPCTFCAILLYMSVHMYICICL